MLNYATTINTNTMTSYNASLCIQKVICVITLDGDQLVVMESGYAKHRDLWLKHFTNDGYSDT